MITIRPLQLSDCTQEYADWLNDPEVNKYLECRLMTHTVDSLRANLNALYEGTTDRPFAILFDGKHIGNIKIGGVNGHHGYAELGYFIGNRAMWGRGYATQAVKLATRHAFEEMNLFHLRAGFYRSNRASWRVLEKAGYEFMGFYRGQLRGPDGGREDHIFCEATSDMWSMK